MIRYLYIKQLHFKQNSVNVKTKMKIISVFCVLVVFLQVALMDDEPELFKSEKESCIKELKLDENKLEITLNKESSEIPEDDLDFIQFLSCVWQKSGYQDERGIINYEKIIELVKNFPKERFGGSFGSGNVGIQIATDAVDSCRNILPGKYPGQTVAKTENCITRQIKEHVEEDESI